MDLFLTITYLMDSKTGKRRERQNQKSSLYIYMKIVSMNYWKPISNWRYFRASVSFIKITRRWSRDIIHKNVQYSKVGVSSTIIIQRNPYSCICEKTSLFDICESRLGRWPPQCVCVFLTKLPLMNFIRN